MRLRSLILLLAAGTLIISLVSCSSKQPSKTTVIRLACWGPPPEMKATNEIISAWEKEHPGVEVKVEHTPPSGYYVRLLTQMASGTPPDVMFCEISDFYDFYGRGAFLDLTPYIKRDKEFSLDGYFPKSLEWGNVGGQTYVIPHSAGPIACLYYNKKLFREAGVPYPPNDWSWSDLLSAARKLTKSKDGRVDQYGLVYRDWLTFVYSNGGGLVDDWRHPTRCALDEPAAKEAIQFAADMILKHKVMRPFDAVRNESNGQVFMTGRAAMFAEGPWYMVQFRDVKSLDWDIATVPRGPRGPHKFATGGSGYGVSSRSKCAELAYSLVKALSGSEFQTKMARLQAGQPALRSVASGTDYLGLTPPPAHREVVIDAMASVENIPRHPHYREAYGKCADELDLVFLGQSSVEEAVKAAVRKANGVLKDKK